MRSSLYMECSRRFRTRWMNQSPIIKLGFNLIIDEPEALDNEVITIITDAQKNSFYKVPVELVQNRRSKLNQRMLTIIDDNIFDIFQDPFETPFQLPSPKDSRKHSRPSLLQQLAEEAKPITSQVHHTLPIKDGMKKAPKFESGKEEQSNFQLKSDPSP